MPPHTAHRVALPDLRPSEQLGIVVSSWFYRSYSSLFVDHPFFTIALHEPVRFSNACSLRRSRSAAQLNVGNRRASRGGHGTIRRFKALALKAGRFRNGSKCEKLTTSKCFPLFHRQRTCSAGRAVSFMEMQHVRVRLSITIIPRTSCSTTFCADHGIYEAAFARKRKFNTAGGTSEKCQRTKPLAR